jgi:outer membrane cobalamin receptor
LKRHRLAAAALCVLGPPCAACSLAAELPPLIVTATRTAQSADTTLASVTVITRAEMERRQSTSVPDLLRGVPGIAVVNSGGPGKATSLFLRGTESDHVLVLIDGIRVGSATSGTTAFQDIPIEQIERVELERTFGPYRLGAGLFAEGRRYDDLANTRALGGYATLDLRSEYALARAWRLQARVENLFDRHYETAAGYRQSGRGIHLTLRYQP